MKRSQQSADHNRVISEYKKSKALVSYRLANILIFTTMVAGIISLYVAPAIAANQWTGVDESVIEKISEENGRSAHDPIINTDNGDLLLFVFLVAGAIGGFVAGYNWRIITDKSGVSK